MRHIGTYRENFANPIKDQAPSKVGKSAVTRILVRGAKAVGRGQNITFWIS
jgi:hypothetical protein